MKSYLDYIIKLNGIYDILCALTILRIIHFPLLQNLHLSMINDSIRKNDIFERFFAYWIFTNGVIRLSNCNELISYSYYLEAAFFLNEYRLESVDKNKTIFVVITSIALGLISIGG